jgi:hypothetical protein
MDVINALKDLQNTSCLKGRYGLRDPNYAKDKTDDPESYYILKEGELWLVSSTNSTFRSAARINELLRYNGWEIFLIQDTTLYTTEEALKALKEGKEIKYVNHTCGDPNSNWYSLGSIATPLMSLSQLFTELPVWYIRDKK